VTVAGQPGKTLTMSANSLAMEGNYYFPTWQGMEEANVRARWSLFGVPEQTYDVLSGVTGQLFQRNGGNQVTGGAGADNVGWGNTGLEGTVSFGELPLDFSSGRLNQINLLTEDINPLYSGEDAVGTYEGTPVTISGSEQLNWTWLTAGGSNWQYWAQSADAASTCSLGNDGTAYSPAAMDSSGWWSGLICGVGHASWFGVTVKAGRSWTLEATAVDETGAASGAKLRPVMGVWRASDPVGPLPTISATVGSMNSTNVGMTQLPVASAGADAALSIAITDLYGAGRPDFAYKARMLYADSVAPAVVGSGGGQITVTGTGFRAGNEVTVNGVKATVSSWSATKIVASVPTMLAAKMAVGVAADVAVIDAGTGGSTVMSGVLSYSNAADVVKLVSAPGVYVGRCDGSCGRECAACGCGRAARYVR
jgi:hypothetical protein